MYVNICVILFQEEKLFPAGDPRSVAPDDEHFGSYVYIYVYTNMYVYKYI